MSSIKDFIGSGGGLDPRNFIIEEIFTSQQWTAPKTGDYFVIVAGGGGSGGLYINYSYAGGGRRGEIKTGIVHLNAGDVVDITIGAGGAPKTENGDGYAGGATSFGTYITAQGGKGGEQTKNTTNNRSRGADLSVSFFGGLYTVATKGGNVFNNDGGDAGLGGDGGDGRGDAKGANAGGGAGYSSTYPSGAGGDGMVVIIYEK